jgi:pimeloyl-ACP methyl ester carboxylesterase
MKRIAHGVALIALAIAVVLGTMRAGLWNPSYEEVKATQATTPSTFEKVGTANLHMRDEGPRGGPVIVMLHSSMTNLREWDAWADALTDKYRVIRFDWPPYGLSTDSAPSTGMPGIVTLLEKVVAQKGVDRFAKAVTQFKAAKVDVIHYPDVGHYPMLELPTDTARDLRQWFDKVLK